MVTPVPAFTDEIAKNGGSSAMLCFQCGTCTAGCPSGRFVAYRIRKLMRAAQLGLKDDTINSEDLWQCTTCYTCAERCPRDVQIVDVVTALRNIAVANGKLYEGHKKVAQNLIKYGHTVDNSKSAQRVELGLPENPPTVLANSAAMAQFNKILEITGFKKLVG
ncbi:MAG: CoB--CoM heterodisulfide reductase subunit C [Methanomassiliicoccaceae archaeon]|jgi:heterodisulfide reductase subunit C|nr:CoB--CoM heterodisulfide reductase subunit C [Methanomassiliicoccaceae archaeon]